MTNVNKPSTSSIAMALAGMSDSVDIPKPRDAAELAGKDNLAAVVAKLIPSGKGHRAGLPTPPNSISPTLPPQAYKGRAPAQPATPPGQHTGDSDIDLLDAVEHARAQDQSHRGLGISSGDENLSGSDTTGAITPALLARHYLPEILLDNGPLPIRHVMSFLAVSVPGFSGIPPPKARRLVVAALEGRGSGGEGGGAHGDVEFEKVGWGKWDAKRRGQPTQTRRRHLSPGAHHSPVLKTRSPSPRSQTLRIPHRSRNRMHSANSHLAFSHPSNNSYSLSQSHKTPDPDHDGVDRMSISGDEPYESSIPEESPDFDMDDDGSVTDEEDWASIGAAALRAASLPKKPLGGGGRIYTANYDYNERARRASAHLKRPGMGLRKSSSGSALLAKSAPVHHRVHPATKPSQHNLNAHNTQFEFSQDQVAMMQNLGQDSSERDAIQALMSLGGGM